MSIASGPRSDSSLVELTSASLKFAHYMAPDGRLWPVSAGTIVDGASIPPAFWSVIGGPFEGLYRDASVVHDYYCDNRERKCGDVHRVFYDAMLCKGVGQRKAWLMYQAVSEFGPQWPDSAKRVPNGKNACLTTAKAPVTRPAAGKAQLMEFVQRVGPEADPADLETLRRSIETTN